MKYILDLLLAIYLTIALGQECAAVENLTLTQAREIAQRELDGESRKYDFVLVPGDIQELPCGWVFGFAPKKFLESHNINELAPGPSAIVVERDGNTHFLPSSPRQHAVADFAHQWRQRHRQ